MQSSVSVAKWSKILTCFVQRNCYFFLVLDLWDTEEIDPDSLTDQSNQKTTAKHETLSSIASEGPGVKTMEQRRDENSVSHERQSADAEQSAPHKGQSTDADKSTRHEHPSTDNDKPMSNQDIVDDAEPLKEKRTKSGTARENEPEKKLVGAEEAASDLDKLDKGNVEAGQSELLRECRDGQVASAEVVTHVSAQVAEHKGTCADIQHKYEKLTETSEHVCAVAGAVDGDVDSDERTDRSEPQSVLRGSVDSSCRSELNEGGVPGLLTRLHQRAKTFHHKYELSKACTFLHKM